MKQFDRPWLGPAEGKSQAEQVHYYRWLIPQLEAGIQELGQNLNKAQDTAAGASIRIRTLRRRLLAASIAATVGWGLSLAGWVYVFILLAERTGR